MAMTFSATAAPQMAKKLAGNAGASRSVEQKASVATVSGKRAVQVLKPRTASSLTAPSLSRALTATALNKSLPRKAAAENASLPNLRGSVIYNESFTEESQPAGLYQVVNGGTELLFEGPNANGGGVLVDGVYYAVYYYSFWGYVFVTVTGYDAESGEEICEYDGNIDNIAVGGMTVDPTTGTVYGITYDANGAALQLATISLSETAMTTTAIAPLDGNWNSIVCDAQGQLYGIDYTGVQNGDDFVVTTSSLNKIDKTTGAVTLIGETGVAPQYLSSATIDKKTGRMFWNVNTADGAGYMAEVNLATGSATKLFDLALNDEIMGLYVAAPLAEADAPAAVTALAADFSKGSLSGNVTFTAPATTFGGAAGSGELTYTVMANDVKAATGSTTFGAAVSVPLTLTESGEYTFTVTTANAAGTSPKSKVKVFVGLGIPEAPTATLAYNGGKMQLSWDAVTATVDGGYIDPAAVTYTVTRHVNDASEVVAEGLKATSFEEAIAEPADITTYYYTVVAHSGTVVSTTAKSNAITLGAIVPPYNNKFDNADCLSGFTILDGNDDGKQWGYYAGAEGADGEPGAVRISYNTKLAMNDWLITPPMKLEAGKAYKVTFYARNNGSSYPERIEAKWGASATAAGMTEELVPATDLTTGKFIELSGFVTPQTAGTYYIGIHGISDADSYYLYVDDLTIAEGMAATAPGDASDVNIVPDANGEYKAAVSFKAPAVDFSGAALTANLTKVEVSRDGNVIKTFTDVAPGAALSFDDVLTAGGTVTYAFQGFNATGAGKIVSKSVFIGIDKPGEITSVDMVETSNPGEVTMTWSAVTTDQNGNAINPAKVSYIVAENNGSGWAPLVQNITTTSYTFQAVPAGQQDFVQYAVFAATEAGTGKGMAGPLLPVGTPYDGLMESFPNGTLNYAWAIGFAEGASWSIFDDSKFSDLQSQDGDNGYAACQGQYLDDTAALMTGKISLANATNPGVSFYAYNLGTEDANEIQLYVKEPADAEWTALGSPFVMSALGDDAGWYKATASLAAYAGKVVEIRFQATVKAYTYTIIDNIKVGSQLGNDLVASKLTAPATVKCGAKYDVVAEVTNNGTVDASAFTVKLYADGELADTKTVEGLASGAKTNVTFACEMSALAEAAVKFYAVVEYAADEDTQNNTSDEVAVAPKQSNLPKVTDLDGKQAEGGIKLTWSEPDLTNAPAEPETATFEDATPFEQSYGDWTFIDGDGKPVGGFQGSNIPGITPGESLVSFFVFDQETLFPGNETFAAHSGTKYLASLFLTDGSAVDDWAISPQLDGSAQTISFWAKSYDSAYPETIQVLYSNAGTATADFTLVAEHKNLSKEWTLFTFDVPAGAKHFAIRSIAADAFMLMIDDVTFVGANATSAELSIVGYDVYRDGLKLTSEPTGETEYVDATATDGDHTYVVVTVYTTGISAPSNEAAVSFTGIEDITVDSADAEYFNLQGIRVANPEKGGLYIRKQGNKAVKVMVK